MKPPPPVTRAFVNIVFLSAVLRANLARGAEHQAPTGIARSSLSRLLDLGFRVQRTAEQDQRTSRHLRHNLLLEGTPASVSRLFRRSMTVLAETQGGVGLVSMIGLTVITASLLT